MSIVFFNEMSMNKPHAFLGISVGSHGSMTGEMLIKAEKLIIRTNTDHASDFAMNAPSDWSIELFGDGNSSDIIAETRQDHASNYTNKLQNI